MIPRYYDIEARAGASGGASSKRSNHSAGLAIFILAFLSGCGNKSERTETDENLWLPPRAELHRLIGLTRDSMLSTYSEEGIIFKYGSDCWNVFNSFSESYTMMADSGPPSTIPLRISKQDFASIIRDMREVGFFNYPDTFQYQTPGGRVRQSAGSGFGVYFGIRYVDAGQLRTKELWWIDRSYNSDPPDDRAENLRSVYLRVQGIVENSTAFKNLKRPVRYRYD